MKKIMLFAVMASLMMFGGCKNNSSKDNKTEVSGEVVLKVGDSEMTSGLFQFFLDNVKSQMEGTELSTEDSWETAEIEGKKAIVGNTRYIGNDYEAFINYKLDGKEEIMYIFYQDFF